ncbi:MAG: LapA family protein [Acidimicrobiales bacterium]
MAYKPEGSDVPLEESSDGPDLRLIARLLVAIAAVVLAILFVAQNSDRVETSFVFFDVTTRLWVGLLVALVLGALLGQAVEAMWERRKRRKAS